MCKLMWRDMTNGRQYDKILKDLGRRRVKKQNRTLDRKKAK